MWKNIVEMETGHKLQYGSWRIARFMSKATDVRPEYVILIAFTLQ